MVEKVYLSFFFTNKSLNTIGGQKGKRDHGYLKVDIKTSAKRRLSTFLPELSH